MPRVIQYQGIAKPVLVPAEAAEDVTLDKWFQPAGGPVRVAGRPVGVGLFSWHTETPSEPDRVPTGVGHTVIGYKRVRQYQATAAPSFVPFVSVFQPQTLEWLSKYPDRVYGKRPLRHQGRHQFFTPRLPELPSWWRSASEPQFKRYAKAIPEDWTVWAPVELPSVQPIQLDQWWQPAQEPVRTAQRWVYTYPTREFQPDQQPEPRADGWLRYWPEPTRRVPTVNHQWLYDPLPAPFEIIVPPPPAPNLSWGPQYPDFARGRMPTYWIGPYMWWYTETGPDVPGAPGHRTKGRSGYKHAQRDGLLTYLPEG